MIKVFMEGDKSPQITLAMLFNKHIVEMFKAAGINVDQQPTTMRFADGSGTHTLGFITVDGLDAPEHCFTFVTATERLTGETQCKTLVHKGNGFEVYTNARPTNSVEQHAININNEDEEL